MPRKARLDAPGTLHHVMVRGIVGGLIFQDQRDREEFVSRIRKLIQATGTRLLAWALLPNHVHLLVLSGPNGLPQFMRRLLTGYALFYNRKYQRKGHLFQNRYKSIVCEEDQYLLELVRYIHLNPLRAGLLKNLDDLDHYPWSGHSALVGKFSNDWQEKHYVLGLFGKAEKTARHAYRKFIEEGKDQGKREDLTGGGLARSLGGWSQVLSLREREEKTEYDSRILGSGDFVSEILKQAESQLKRQLRLGQKKGAIDLTIKTFCEQQGIKEEEVRNGSQRRVVSHLRADIAYRLNRDLGISMAEIARNLGVSTPAIIKAIQRMEAQLTC